MEHHIQDHTPRVSQDSSSLPTSLFVSSTSPSTLPEYMNAFNTGLKDEKVKQKVLQLVQSVKEKGAQVRKINQQFREKAKELLKQMIDDLKINVDAWHDELYDKLKLLTTQYPFCSDHSMEYSLVKLFINDCRQMKQRITEKRDEIEKFKESPPGMDQFFKSAESFNSSVDELADFCCQYFSPDFRIPWQLSQCACVDPDCIPTSGAVSLEGGKVTDKDGNNIFGVECYMCGVEIQDGATGAGQMRYQCLDRERTNLCVKCYEMRQFVLNTVKKKDSHQEEIRLLREFDKDLDSFFVLQSEIDSFLRFPILDAPSLALAIHTALKIYAKRPCFVHFQECTDGEKMRIMNYDEVLEKSIHLALYMKFLLVNQNNKQSGIYNHHIGICSSENRPEWIITDFACVFNDFMSVGIHANWPVEDIIHVCKNAKITCIVCDNQMASIFLEEVLPKCEQIIAVIIMDGVDTCSIAVQHKGIHVASFESIMSMKFSECEKTCHGISKYTSIDEKNYTNKDNYFSLIYSSGTSGMPKGVIVTKESWHSGNIKQGNFTIPNVCLSYAALAHGMDRGICWQTISNGGRIAFSREADVLKRAVEIEPVFFIAMPHIWNLIYSKYISDIESEFNSNKQESDKELINKKILKKYSTILGSRIQRVATGGSAISTAVLQFMNDCFKMINEDIVVVNAYGTTECPGISTNGVINPHVKVKLRDIPEMGYCTTDKPFSRGEILVQSKFMTTGYYNLEEETKALFDKEGWMCTGDVGEIDDEGHLHIIDRKKDLSELYVDGRSVWISNSSIESTLRQSKFIKQVFVYGDRAESHLIAVVVPNNQNKQDQEKLKQSILLDFNSIIKKHQLPDYYCPKGIVLENEHNEWNPTNGFLTINGKMRRNKLLSKYKIQIDLEYGKSKQ